MKAQSNSRRKDPICSHIGSPRLGAALQWQDSRVTKITEQAKDTRKM